MVKVDGVEKPRKCERLLFVLRIQGDVSNGPAITSR